MEPVTPSGWTRLAMKSKFGAGRDFAVLDAAGAQVYFVDGKMGARPSADVKDSAGEVLYRIKGHVLGIPKEITISDSGGREVATLKAKMFSPIKSKATLTMLHGAQWHVEGSLMEKDYDITADGAPVVRISQKWVTVRDSYTLDVIDGIDPGLALAVVWAIDRWVERD